MSVNNLLFVVGIDHYVSSPQFPRLNNAVSDATQLIKVLEDKYNFKEQKYLLNEDATTQAITNALVELKHLQPQDNLIFFFSGHGAEDSDTHKGQIVPVNAKERSDLISFSTIKNEYLDCVKAKHILLIFDCCYSGNFIIQTRGPLEASTIKITDTPSRYFLGSGGNEKVSDGKMGESSPFTRYLLEFLKNNIQKHFLTTELALYIRKYVGNNAKQQPVYEPIQIDGHCGGEYAFVLDDKYVEEPNSATSPSLLSHLDIKEDFNLYLEDAGVKYYHSRKDDVTLSDIFVEPYLKTINLENYKSTTNQYIRLWTVVNSSNEDKNLKLVIIGSETSGKTTLCKRVFDRCYQEGLIPILLNGKDDIKEIQKEKFISSVKKIFNKQYQNFAYEELDANKIVLIIDDFHKFKITKSKDFRDVLIKNINTSFNNIIIIGDTLMPLEIMTQDKKIKNIFDEYSIYQLIEFGSKLRHELIEKWHCIGQEKAFLDKNELFRLYDERDKQVRSIIGKNYMPAFPFYILTIIQTLESENTKPEYSLHGFYYQHLIDVQLNEAVKNKEDISLYYNYITEFCFFLFNLKQKSTSISRFEEFHHEYSERYAISYSYQNILRSLHEAKILNVNGEVKIQYNYIYYFFVAKYLTNNLSSPGVKEIITKMCQRLYREEYANIVMFLTHLSQEPFIIGEILKSAKSIFPDSAIIELDTDIKGLNILIKDIPNQAIELVDAEDVRKEELEETEEIEMLEKEYENEKQEISEYDLDENIDNINLISKIVLSFKTIEILGQLTKKYWGSLDKQKKYAVAEETYFLGLRTLKNYLDLVQDNSGLISDIIKELILKKKVKDRFSLKKIAESTANDFIFRLCFLSSYGVIKRISNAIGYPKLYPVLQDVLKNNQTNAVRLIDLSIKLDHEGKIPIEKIIELNKGFIGNKLCYLVLRNLVLDRLYYFDEDISDMQKLSTILNIPIQQQRYINATSRVKKE